jgi:hypothetical protein
MRSSYFPIYHSCTKYELCKVLLDFILAYTSYASLTIIFSMLHVFPVILLCHLYTSFVMKREESNMLSAGHLLKKSILFQKYSVSF